MATPPARSEISGTPTNAAANAGFGKLWDFLTGLLGTVGTALDARNTLGISATNTPSTAVGGISATNVQAALAELDSEKEPTITTLSIAKGGTASGTRAGAVASLGLEASEISIASAATTAIGAAAGTNILITTTAATITAFDNVAAGIWRRCRISAAGITLQNSAALILPGAANIVCAANDFFEACSLGSGNWIVVNYFRNSGVSIVSNYAKLGTKQTWTAQQAPMSGTLTDAATVTWDGDNASSGGQVVAITLSSAGGTSRSFAAPTNIVQYATYLLRITQADATARTIVWNAAFKFTGGTAPSLSSGSGKVDIISFIGGAGNTLECIGVKQAATG